MDDLDTLLQDYSYLKSLEFKDRVPNKVAKSLFLPSPNCIHMMRMRFEDTREITFKRLFKRPIARKCFSEFVCSDEETTKSSISKKLLNFLNDVEQVGKPFEHKKTVGYRKKSIDTDETDKSVDSFDQLNQIHMKYMIDESLRCHPTLWSDESLWENYEGKLKQLKQIIDTRKKLSANNTTTTTTTNNNNNNNNNTQSTLSSSATHGFGIMRMFPGFVSKAMVFLEETSWPRFLKSEYFVHYAQWKQLELNMTVGAEDFDIHRILGRGGFGEVYGCRKRDTGCMFAMKQLDKKRLKMKEQEKSVLHERNVLSEMNSNFVTKLKYAFQDPDKLYLLMNLMDGGDLSFQLKQVEGGIFTDYQAKFYAAEIILGLAHIHSRKMIYRDLKPANVLLDSYGHARISDMGLVRDCKRSWPTSECGTHGYMAPEVIASGIQYGYSSDWFSLGCTVFEFLVGYPPFNYLDDNKRRPSAAIIDARTTAGAVNCPDSMSLEAKSFVLSLLMVDAGSRLGSRDEHGFVSDPQAIQDHQWFEYIDYQALIELKVDPPIVPKHGQVNAKDVYEIDRFTSHETRKIKLTHDDHAKYRRFNHIMSHEWQHEVLPMFEMVRDVSHVMEQKRWVKIISTKKEEPPDAQHILLEGFMMKEGHGVFARWAQRYVHVFPDRIEWRNTELQHSKRCLQFEFCDFHVENEDGVDGDVVMVLGVRGEDKVYRLKAFYAMDTKYWCRTIDAAYHTITGKHGLTEKGLTRFCHTQPERSTSNNNNNNNDNIINTATTTTTSNNTNNNNNNNNNNNSSSSSTQHTPQPAVSPSTSFDGLSEKRPSPSPTTTTTTTTTITTTTPSTTTPPPPTTTTTPPPPHTPSTTHTPSLSNTGLTFENQASSADGKQVLVTISPHSLHDTGPLSPTELSRQTSDSVPPISVATNTHDTLVHTAAALDLNKNDTNYTTTNNNNSTTTTTIINTTTTINNTTTTDSNTTPTNNNSNTTNSNNNNTTTNINTTTTTPSPNTNTDGGEGGGGDGNKNKTSGSGSQNESLHIKQFSLL